MAKLMTAPAGAATSRPMIQGRSRAFRAFLSNRTALLGAAILLLIALLATVGPIVSPYDPETPSLADRLQGPSAAHIMGTDELGRDMATRIAHGARISVALGFLAVALAAVLGVPVGLAAGYFGGRIDILIQRTVDVLLTLPSIVLAIILAAVLGTGVQSVVLAVGISSLPVYARLARAVALTLRSRDYIAAARVLGATDTRILAKHLLPNALPPIIVQASLGVGAAILVASSLGFLGLGVQPPMAEWGAMLSRGRTFITSAPQVIAFPGVAIALTVLAFNLLGDGLRDALDPRLQQLAK